MSSIFAYCQECYGLKCLFRLLSGVQWIEMSSILALLLEVQWLEMSSIFALLSGLPHIVHIMDLDNNTNSVAA